MTKEELFEFVSRHRLAVLATVAPNNTPEAAVMGFAVTPDLEIIFDTVKSARKYQNMIGNPKVALVIGWDHEVTVQYEGVADEPAGEELERCRNHYFGTWPECRDHVSWPGLTYFRVRPTWIRYSDFNDGSRQVAEFSFPSAAACSSAHP